MRAQRQRIGAWLLAAWAPLSLPPDARAYDIVKASYDRQRDEMVVVIEYRGTHRHAFHLEWGPCRAQDNGMPAAAAQVVDPHFDDMARDPFRVVERFGLSGLPCPRPAVVTLRTSATEHATVYVPARAR